MDLLLLVRNLEVVILCLLLSNSIPHSYSQTAGSNLQVTKHFLTLRPTSQEVTVPAVSCNTVDDYSRCEGELNGQYTWVKENTETNYVLFVLNQRAVITQINLTYIVASATETPKVSFCIVSDETFINSSFENLDCNEMSIQPSASGAEQIGILQNTPINNYTNKVAMEVITESIKVNFIATRVQFFGTYETTVTPNEPATSNSTVTTTNSTIGETSQSVSTTADNGGAMPGAIHTRKTYSVAILSAALSIYLILTLTVIV